MNPLSSVWLFHNFQICFLAPATILKGIALLLLASHQAGLGNAHARGKVLIHLELELGLVVENLGFLVERDSIIVEITEDCQLYFSIAKPRLIDKNYLTRAVIRL